MMRHIRFRVKVSEIEGDYKWLDVFEGNGKQPIHRKRVRVGGDSRVAANRIIGIWIADEALQDFCVNGKLSRLRNHEQRSLLRQARKERLAGVNGTERRFAFLPSTKTNYHQYTRVATWYLLDRKESTFQERLRVATIG